MRHAVIFTAAAVLFSACAEPAPAPAPATAQISAVRETAAVDAEGDAADDPAIWVAPDPGQSLVLATQKDGGLYVFDMNGAIVQQVLGGRPNNIDLREGFGWSEGAAPLVGASDRSDNTIVLWRFDPAGRQIEPTPRVRIATGFAEIYGFCLGRMGEDFVAIASNKADGEIGVWRIVPASSGALAAERIATFTLGSITEGCVVDDDAGVLYLAQELVGVWRVALADADGSERVQIDRVGEGGNLVADVEGLTIWRGADGGGYLIASVQGASRFAVYDRGGENAYRGAFQIGASADGGADAVEGTDGIDIVAAPLGPEFPQGLFVAQDDENTNPAQFQNFKYASWADVAAALELPQRALSSWK